MGASEPGAAVVGLALGESEVTLGSAVVGTPDTALAELVEEKVGLADGLLEDAVVRTVDGA